MASNRCPACISGSVSPVQNQTHHSTVEYQRCDACGRIWLSYIHGRVTRQTTSPYTTSRELLRRLNAAIARCRQLIGQGRRVS